MKREKSRMAVKELFEKYCEKTEDDEYVVQGHCVKLCPATAEELQTFKGLMEMLEAIVSDS